MSEQTGTFYAVSVGPGDSELLTLQAVRVLENTPVIAAPQTASGQMLALDIARGAVDLTGKSVLPLRFTMSHDAAVRAESYRAAASAVEAELRQGRDVAPERSRCRKDRKGGWIPAFAGMTRGGEPGFCHSREHGNPCV